MEKIKTLAIVQARMGSTRLPNKVLLPLFDKSVIEHVVERVKRSNLIDDVIVATSIDVNNLPLIKLCSEKNIRIFIGSEDDVLDRYYQITQLLKPEIIVRITADCPVIDPDIIDKTIQHFYNNNADYSNNKQTADGLGCEVFSVNVLENAWENAKLQSEREHVTPYIKKHNSCSYYMYEPDISEKRWTVDEESDFRLINCIYNELYLRCPQFKTNDILSLLQKKPELELINNFIGRDEGYSKSIKNDRIIK